MPIKSPHLLTLSLLAGLVLPLAAQQPAANTTQKPRPEDTEVWEPVPRVVAPGTSTWTAPADALVLFDGKNLDEWVATKDKSPAKWTVGDGVMTVNKPAGNIETKRSFKSYQLHLEWRIPEKISGTGHGRGNSGLFLASTGPGDAGYELGNIPLGWVERFESDGENQAAGGSQCKRQAQCQGALLRVAQ